MVAPATAVSFLKNHFLFLIPILKELIRVIYEATVDNLQALMRACIVLDRTQIYRFFSAHHDQSRIDFFIDFLIKERLAPAAGTPYLTAKGGCYSVPY